MISYRVECYKREEITRRVISGKKRLKFSLDYNVTPPEENSDTTQGIWIGNKFFVVIKNESFHNRQEALKDAAIKSLHFDLVIVSDEVEELWRSLKTI